MDDAGSDDAVDGADVPTPGDPDPLRAYRSWAAVLFSILLIVAVLVTAVVLGSGTATARPTLLASAVASALVTITLAAVLALGVVRMDAWAIHAIAPVCLVLIVVGVVRSVVALASSEVTIPLEAVGGALVLTRDHRASLLPPLDGNGRRTMQVVVATFTVSQVLGVAGPLLSTIPPFATTSDALSLSVELACPASPGSETPIVAEVRWTWTRGEPFPPPADGLLVEWSMTMTGTPVPADGAVLLGERTSDPDAIDQGGSDPASSMLVGAAEPGASVEYAIEPPAGTTLDGWVALDLAPAELVAPGDPVKTAGGLDVRAWYAHGDRWVKPSGMTTCSWP